MRARKKPVEIECYQMTAEGWARRDTQEGWPSWLVDAWHGQGDDGTINESRGTPYIGTIEGVLTMTLGDWIIRGVQGEIYPCKPEIFAATYDLLG